MKPMWRIRLNQAALAAALTVMTGSALAQAPAPAARPAIEGEAMTALKAMSAYLRTLKTFQVEVAVVDEDVLDDGQKVQYTGVTNVLAQMPSRLRVDISNERRDRLYLYDGKEFTLFGKRLNYYATIPAPPTIAQLADKIEEDYGESLPLADLFRWSSPSWTPDEITGATDFGPSDIEGTTCQHYLFRQADVDWQLWIQKGDYPLPRKIVITTKTDEARPQHTAVYTWNLAPSFNDRAFVFDPPAGARKVLLGGISPLSGMGK
jgi:hypothetical protein